MMDVGKCVIICPIPLGAQKIVSVWKSRLCLLNHDLLCWFCWFCSPICYTWFKESRSTDFAMSGLLPALPSKHLRSIGNNESKYCDLRFLNGAWESCQSYQAPRTGPMNLRRHNVEFFNLWGGSIDIIRCRGEMTVGSHIGSIYEWLLCAGKSRRLTGTRDSCKETTAL